MAKKAIFILLFILNIADGAFAQAYKPDMYGYIADPGFKTLINKNGYSIVGAFLSNNGREPVANALKDGAWVKINTSGEIVTTAQKLVKDIGLRGDKGEDELFDPFKYVHPSNAGLAIISKNGKMGLVNNNTQQIIIPANYDELKLTNFKFVIVKQNGKWGTISKKGKAVTAPKYDQVKSLGVNMEGTSYITGDAEIVRIGTKWGLLSTNGDEIITPKFDEIKNSWVLSSIMISKLGDKWGLLNKSGKELVVPTYSQIDDFDALGVATVYIEENGLRRYGLIDSLGNELVKPVYTKLYLIDKKFRAAGTGVEPNIKYGLVDIN